MPTSQNICHHDKRISEGPQSKFVQDAPPLMPTLTSSKYHIKWTQLADLPATMFGAYVVMQDRKIYVSGGVSPVEDAKHQVFVYDTDNDRWGQLPTPDHYGAVPHIIGGKLTLIGGNLITTYKVTNKVSTFDQTKQSWVSYYPDLLSLRRKPGVVTHVEYAIVAGGARGDDTPVVLDDIEILDWVENSQWKRVSMHLPVPMCNLKFTIVNDHVFVVGYVNADGYFDNHVYKLQVALITDPAEHTSTSWEELVPTVGWNSSLVTGLFQLIVIGGVDAKGATVEDVNMYDTTTEKWEKN